MKQKQLSNKPISQPFEYLEENILITLTIFSLETELIEWLATEFIERLCKNLNYIVKKITTGRHVEASRPHYHIMFAVNTDKQKTYKGEGLKSKIQRLSKLIACSSKDIDNIWKSVLNSGTQYKVSFVKEGEPKVFKKKTVNYGVEAMRYVFKEYSSNAQIELTLQSGFTVAELHAMRESAYMDWRIVKKKQSDEALANIAKKEEFLTEQVYLKNHFENVFFSTSDEMIKHAMNGIWLYSKQMYKANKIQRIQHNQVANKAINFLIFNDYLDHTEIAGSS